MNDIKEIATTMSNQFAEAVRAAEKRDAEEIESISKTFNDAYLIYAGQLDSFRMRRNELNAELEKVYADEEAAMVSYQNEVLSLAARLDAYRGSKLGIAPESNNDNSRPRSRRLDFSGNYQ